MKGFSTKAIHGVRFKPDAHGSLRMPIYDTVSFEHESAKAIELAFGGKRPAHAYTRISNPTIEDFEQKMRLLSGGMAVLALSSGMAAISNLVMTLCEAGTNLVTSRHLFGNTVSLFEHSLKPWGLEVRYADMTNPAEVASLIDENTRLVFLEIITNPQMEVADIKALSAITHQKGVPLILDGTVTTPVLFRSKDFGVDVEILSSTKYISGGATSVGGVIIDNGNFDWKQAPRLAEKAKRIGPMAMIATLRMEVYRNLGACLAPHNAYLQSLGLETLGLRIERSCDNALALAQFLESAPKVKKVNYPGLATSPFNALAQSQFGGYGGGIVSFEMESREAAFRIIDGVGLIKRATNVNDNKSMIIHPASTIFCEYSPEEKLEMQVPEELIRLSVGIEDLEDLIDDLTQALETV
ncbi:MAG: O-acetylhomoserine sulfhydrylase [Candidatus Lambdaproteobacteria bacterium RIFOXYD2_FULL_50_16]|uniref:O-acetylhomoserine sulfhydrylase n=1 Tax=Candidatus Lambdaproteobacteria bacterium RIFOXYD2_FULL_50_16 TaxID=1817772 RepID=A0A1F6G9D4_9PROT|nr:MAG: O-acetylhomoserine sulfhydrylase [Candidatus Lambdaproteobacteria bacterium RIFOXYD2_FULL_50_16]